MKLAASPLLLAFSLLTFSCGNPQQNLLLCHDIALEKPAREVLIRFGQNHPSWRLEKRVVQPDGVPEGEMDDCLLLLTPDPRLLRRIFAHAEKAYRLFSDSLVVAFPPDSPEELTREFWEAMAMGRRRSALADPSETALGVHSLLAWKLAEGFYSRPGLYRLLLEQGGRERKPLLEIIRELEEGRLQGAILYKSLAVQHSLPFRDLPPAVSLGESSHEKQYGKVFWSEEGEAPLAGETITHVLFLRRDAGERARRLFDFWLTSEMRLLFREWGYTTIPISPWKPSGP